MYLRETRLAGSGGKSHHWALPKVFAAAPSHFQAQTSPRPGADPGLKDYSEFQRITRAQGFSTITTEIMDNKILQSCGRCSSASVLSHRTEKPQNVRGKISCKRQFQNQICSLEGEKAENVKALLKCQCKY